jgi:putative membrane protein
MEPYHWWWPMWGVMWILPLLFLILLVVFLFRGPAWLWRGRSGWDDKRESPREILDRRYASGEITKEQYEEMRRTLER